MHWNLSRRHAPGIRERLIRLVILSALPVWIASAALIFRDSVEQRAFIERDARATVRALMLSVDRDLASAISAAQVLATSPQLLSGDLAAFHGRARVALPPTIGFTVVLTDASGQQILNTLVPYGQALPRKGDPQQVRRVFETGQPVISDLYMGGVSRRLVLSIDVPVLRDGAVLYDLSIGLLPERLGELLAQGGLPPDWVGAIFDSKGVIVARTHAAAEFVGQAAAPGLLRRLAEVREGIVETHTLEGIPVSSVFTRSDVSSWAVAVGIPTAELMAPLWRSLGWSVAGTLLLVMLGIGAARYLSERLARPIRALAEPSLALGEGQPIEIPPLGLKEADDLGRALVQAAHLLVRRTAERDETERARQQILGAKEQAQQQAQVRSAYFAYLSHELRSPISAIIGYAELLASKSPGLSAKERGYADTIDKAGVHVLTLINEILDYAQYEAEEIHLVKEPVAIGDLLREVVGLFAGQAERENIRLSLAVDPDLPPLHADPRRLRQILINLLSNALKFTPAGGAVGVTVYPPTGEAIAIEVADTGIGISAEDLPRIMEPFAQVMDPRTRKHTGTGLGLPLTKGLVELHGGSFKIASTLGSGTKVAVRLPVVEEAGVPLSPERAVTI